MWRSVILYGIFLFVLLALLKMVEYRYMIRELSPGAFLLVIALLSSAYGIWLGLKMRRINNRNAKHLVKADPVSFDDALSERELEVLQLLATGLTNKQIGEHLFISRNTVKTHISNIFQKMNVTSRTQAIHRAGEWQIQLTEEY